MSEVTTYSVFNLADGIIYGPVKSRRLGASLGLNILPFGRKVCSFNCGYCQCGWTYDLANEEALKGSPNADEVREAVAQRLKKANEDGEHFDSLTFAGNGEPTLNPEFYEIVKNVVEVRDAAMPKAKVGILSNSATLDNPQVRAGLNLLDDRIMKLDAGSYGKMLDVNTPIVDVTLEDIIAGLKTLEQVIIQAMFVRGRVDNTTDEDIEAWIEAVGGIQPRYVQIYSLDRFPADTKLKRVPGETLAKIAKRLEEKTGIKGEVF